jgi:putative peptidoglycan lipid II flippase
MVAIFGAMLQVHGRFGPTASAPIVLNAFLVVAAAGLTKAFDHHNPQQETLHMGMVAASVLLAGIVQVVWSIWSLHRADRQWFVGTLRHCKDAIKPMRAVLRQAVPMFIGLGILQINTFVDGLIASYPSTIGPKIFGYDFPLDPGALTAINNAARLYEFPLGVFGIAVATAIFPALARVTHDAEAFADILRRGLRLVIYIGLPASVGLILVREPLTAAILQGGDFTSADTARVAFVLLGYAPAIWAYSMTHTLTRAFYARGDSITPVKVAVGMVLLNFSLNVTLIWTPLKEAGLAWSTAIAAIVQVFILLRLTRRYASHVVDQSVLNSWLRTAIMTLIMAAIVWWISRLLPNQLIGWHTKYFDANALVKLMILVIAGAAAVTASSLTLRMPELWWALGKRTASANRNI